MTRNLKNFTFLNRNFIQVFLYVNTCRKGAILLLGVSIGIKNPNLTHVYSYSYYITITNNKFRS